MANDAGHVNVARCCKVLLLFVTFGLCLATVAEARQEARHLYRAPPPRREPDLASLDRFMQQQASASGGASQSQQLLRKSGGAAAGDDGAPESELKHLSGDDSDATANSPEAASVPPDMFDDPDRPASMRLEDDPHCRELAQWGLNEVVRLQALDLFDNAEAADAMAGYRLEKVTTARRQTVAGHVWFVTCRATDLGSGEVARIELNVYESYTPDGPELKLTRYRINNEQPVDAVHVMKSQRLRKAGMEVPGQGEVARDSRGDGTGDSEDGDVVLTVVDDNAVPTDVGARDGKGGPSSRVMGRESFRALDEPAEDEGVRLASSFAAAELGRLEKLRRPSAQARLLNRVVEAKVSGDGGAGTEYALVLELYDSSSDATVRQSARVLRVDEHSYRLTDDGGAGALEEAKKRDATKRFAGGSFQFGGGAGTLTSAGADDSHEL